MSKTVAEHLREGRFVVSDQRAITQLGLGGIPFAKVMQAYTHYELEAGYTKLPKQQQRLERLAGEAETVLVDFLGSVPAVREATAIWSDAQAKKNSSKRFEEAFADTLEHFG